MAKPKLKNKRPVTHDQWVEIKRINGKTVTEYYPPNEVFEAERKERVPAPVLIYRRLYFVHGVPDEYLWMQPPEDVRELGGLVIIRLLVNDWLQALKEERTMSPRHVASAPSQPMPPELGVCSCDRCTRAREDNDE